jgi:TonB-linked SusC/RagA family outer membrane protein
MTAFFNVKLPLNIKYHASFNYSWRDAIQKQHPTLGDAFSFSRDETAYTYNDLSKLYLKHTYSHTGRWSFQTRLDWAETYGKHDITAMVGFEAYKVNDQSSASTKTGFENEVLEEFNNVLEATTIEGTQNGYAAASLFGRATYAYDSKYLAEVNIRYYGSSRFASRSRWGLFPSISAGWVITREPWMESVRNWMNLAKVRFSWGQNGNERIGSFQYTSMMSQGKNAVIDGKVYTGMLPSGYANADLVWETSEQIDLGLDFRFFNNALTFTVDYFEKYTKDMLMNMPIPRYTSYGSMIVNAGTVENKGVELEASYKFNIGKVNFAVGANATYLQNTVTNQGTDRTGLDNVGGGMGGTVTYAENGRPYGFFYGYVHDGIFQNQKEIDSYTYVDGEGKTQLKQPNAKPGDIRFKDLDGKNGINADDRTMIGNPIPDWTFGLNLYAEWKGLDFSAFFQGTQGNDIFKLYRRSNLGYANWDKAWLNRWHGEGTSDFMPRVVEGDNENYRISDFFVEDGSYIRLKVLQIGYSFPKKWMDTIHVKGLRLFLQGDNLFTITKYSGYDPEVGTRNGFDGGTYPQARAFTIGANITF